MQLGLRKDAVRDLPLSLNRDLFLRKLLRELSGALENVVGVEEASGFISIVGQNVGEWLNMEYRRQLRVPQLSREQVEEALVDLKRRIQGDFRVVSADGDTIVLRNSACPFGDKVRDRPSLCMMTSNVFGVITAENLGYAKVVLKETVARGSGGCHVVIHLRPTHASDHDDGHEYFRS